jgi:G:T-mismatch repair DNA endonuclease (very short patch repair protein)
LLEVMGWKVAVIWECQTKDEVTLKGIIQSIFP